MRFRNRIVELAMVRARDLAPDEQNWRKHPQGQRTATRALIEQLGFVDALIARKDGDRLVLVDGHMRRDFDRNAQIPVLVTDLTEAEAHAFMALADPLAAMAEADAAAHRALVEKAKVDAASLQALRARLLGEELLSSDAATKKGRAEPRAGVADELQRKWKVKHGDLWEAGPHRIVCGNNEEAEAIALLMGKRQADLVVTDPPFAIYGSSTGVSADAADDSMIRPFFRRMFHAIADLLPWQGHAYVNCDWRSWATLYTTAAETPMRVRNMIVWDKGGSGLGNNYANTHELVAFLHKVPDKGVTGNRRVPEKSKPVFRSNIFRISRAPATDRLLHNAAKPVALVRELIANSSEPGHVVLDLYGGSGTTIVAAHELERVGHAIDEKPKWVAVMLERLALLGLKPRRVGR